MVESQVAIIPMVKAAAGRHGGPTVASYHCSQMPFISVMHVPLWRADERGAPWTRSGRGTIGAVISLSSSANAASCMRLFARDACHVGRPLCSGERFHYGARGESKGECRATTRARTRSPSSEKAWSHWRRAAGRRRRLRK